MCHSMILQEYNAKWFSLSTKRNCFFSCHAYEFISFFWVSTAIFTGFFWVSTAKFGFWPLNWVSVARFGLRPLASVSVGKYELRPLAEKKFALPTKGHCEYTEFRQNMGGCRNAMSIKQQKIQAYYRIMTD